MDKEKRGKLESKGWMFGTVADFLGLSRKEDKGMFGDPAIEDLFCEALEEILRGEWPDLEWPYLVSAIDWGSVCKAIVTVLIKTRAATEDQDDCPYNRLGMDWRNCPYADKTSRCPWWIYGDNFSVPDEPMCLTRAMDICNCMEQIEE